MKLACCRRSWASLWLAPLTSRRLVLLFATSLARATPPIVIQTPPFSRLTKGTLNGSVLIRDGKIAEVGEKL